MFIRWGKSLKLGKKDAVLKRVSFVLLLCSENVVTLDKNYMLVLFCATTTAATSFIFGENIKCSI